MYSSKSLSERSKRLGNANQSNAYYIPASKTHSFEVLFKYLVNYYGGIGKAEEALMMEAGQSLITRALKDKKLSEHYAKKILNKFNEVKKRKANG
tara:strand:+ start:417 stop:701 length:285 start_codon:yes stop_codon:yes gene_type:complete